MVISHGVLKSGETFICASDLKVSHFVTYNPIGLAVTSRKIGTHDEVFGKLGRLTVLGTVFDFLKQNAKTFTLVGDRCVFTENDSN